MIYAVIFIYVTLVLIIGIFSHKLFRGTGEDYFVATRTIGPFVLFMSLFGTHMTAFSILGASGEAYHEGIGVFALMASSSALITPCVFFFIGTRVWAVGKKHGYLTQIQYFRDRWDSSGLGLLLFVVLNLLLIPYVLIGVQGGGLTLSQMTKGGIPEWAGGLGVCAVILIYVTYGGMRGTAWVNTFQTMVFMVCGALAFLVIVNDMGGLTRAMSMVAEKRPDLLVSANHIQPLQLLTYTLIPLSAGMFPHLFIHWLTAKRASAFRSTLILYPIAIAVVWVPSVLLGVIGTVDFPELKGVAANSILVRLIELHAPTLLAGLLAAGVVSSVMNSLDSQSLAIGSMFTQDIVRHYGFHDRMTEGQQVFFGRLFVAAVLLISYALSLNSNRSIFRVGVWAFSGFAALIPIVVAALYWKRSTKAGAYACILSVIVTWLYFFYRAGDSGKYTVGGTGIMPVGVMLLISTMALVIVSWFTRAPNQVTLDKFFPPKPTVEDVHRMTV